MEDAPNPLISTQKSDSDLQVSLHPMVLLTISDHITRHHARQQPGPIVGALLGRQKEERREITLEHAFECHLLPGEGSGASLHQAWFDERLKQFKDVHKAPQLDLMGWFTNAPPSGPSPAFLQIHRQILKINDSAVLLTFHPSLITEQSSSGGKLPLTIYETVSEEDGADLMDADKMEDTDEPLNIKFREVPYSIETGEAEMISVDFVARGGGSAVVTGKQKHEDKEPSTKQADVKESDKPSGKEVNGASSQTEFSPDEEDLIATLTARLNATRMLQSRISLLKSYLAHLPASYLNDSTEPPSSDSSDSNALTTSYPVLRSISALVSRLALLTPASSALFDIESKAEQNDVNLINLLGTVGKGLGDARDIGRKFHVVENGKQARKGGGGGLGGGPVDGMRNPVDETLGQEMKGREGQQMGIRSNQWQS